MSLDVGWSWKPKQTGGEHVTSTQKGPGPQAWGSNSLLWGDSTNHCTIHSFQLCPLLKCIVVCLLLCVWVKLNKYIFIFTFQFELYPSCVQFTFMSGAGLGPLPSPTYINSKSETLTLLHNVVSRPALIGSVFEVIFSARLLVMLFPQDVVFAGERPWTSINLSLWCLTGDRTLKMQHVSNIHSQGVYADSVKNKESQSALRCHGNAARLQRLLSVFLI